MRKTLSITARYGSGTSADPTKDPERKLTMFVSSQLTPGQEEQAATDLVRQQLGDGWRVAGIMY